MRLFVLLCALMVGTATAEVNGLDAVQERTYQQLIAELRCLVCQNQTIAESNAPLAVDLREQVRVQLVQGRSKAEITTYLTDRYGDFVLYRPPFKASTALLWAGPFLLLLAGLVMAWRWVRAKPAASAPPRLVSEAEVQKLLDETRAALKRQDEP
jgi:cytochrome c-type biogenesis protein CcmH